MRNIPPVLLESWPMLLHADMDMAGSPVLFALMGTPQMGYLALGRAVRIGDISVSGSGPTLTQQAFPSRLLSEDAGSVKEARGCGG